MRLRFVLALLTLLLVVTTSDAQLLRIGSIAAARFGGSWTLDGGAMTETRSKLENDANFGIGGTVGRDIEIVDTEAALSALLLADFNIVFIGYLDDADAKAFTADELDALVAWVEGGGDILITCDDDDYDAVCARFGAPVDDQTGDALVNTSGAGFGHPALQGPFGEVRQVISTGDVATFSETTGGLALMRNASNGAPSMLVGQVGGGRVVLLGDVDMISDYGLYTFSDSIFSPNDLLLGNVIAWLAGESSSGACLPSATALCIDDLPGDGRFRITVSYDTVLGGGLSGEALAVPLAAVGADQGGLFTFFDPTNPELLLKVLNGCAITGHYWVYFSAGTNAGFVLTIEDLVLGGSPPYVYTNLDLTAPPAIQDIYALPCS